MPSRTYREDYNMRLVFSARKLGLGNIYQVLTDSGTVLLTLTCRRGSGGGYKAASVKLGKYTLELIWLKDTGIKRHG